MNELASLSAPDGSNGAPGSPQMLQNHSVEEHSLREIWFAKVIVKYPCAVFWIMVVILVILGGIYSVVNGAMDAMDLFDPGRGYYVNSDNYVEQLDAYNLAADFVMEVNDTKNSTTLPQTEQSYTISFYFTNKNYDDDMDSSTNYWILDKENIELMIEYENKIMLDEDWKNQFCYVGEDPLSTNYSCSTSVSSIVRTIYEMSNYSTMSDDDIKDWVLENYEYYYYYLNPDVDKYEQVYRVRSWFTAGTPFSTNWSIVNGTSTRESTYMFKDEDEEEEYESDLITDLVDPLWTKITIDEKTDYTDGELNIIIFNPGSFDDILLDSLMVTMYFFCGAVVVVGLYMCFHLESCCLGCGAMTQILLSFVMALFWYRVVFQINYIDFLSFLVIFVILGIGADDVFVFTDAWHQSLHFVEMPSVRNLYVDDGSKCCRVDHEKEKITRMSYTYRRAASAMLTTQATTFFAFIATAISQLMAMKAFGFWAAIVVASNYILVITLYPAMLMIHDMCCKKCEHKCCQLLLCCKKTTTDERPPEIIRTLSVKDGVVDIKNFRMMERFFGGKWIKWMDKSKICNLILFFILFVVGVVFGVQIEGEDETESLYKSSSWLHNLETIPNDFGTSEEDGLLTATITYGVSGVDRSEVKMITKSTYAGEIIWDDDFEMYTTEQQEYLYSNCQRLKNSSLVYEPPNSEYVVCPIEEWESYLISLNESFPYDAENKSAFAEMWSNFLESDYAEETIENSLSYVEEDDGDYMVRFYAMNLQMPVTESTVDPSDAEKYRDDIDKFIDEVQAACPDSLCDQMGNSCWKWMQLATAEAFVNSAWSGIALAIPLSFVVLLISTRNWIVSILALLDVIGVIACELCTIRAVGWKMGTIEALSVVMLIGFSIDYVVHVANAYLESKGDSRMERMSFALLTMGVSVLAGAITTALSGIMLVFPSFLMFYKMGIIIMTVVVYALLWAMIFFSSIMLLIGPEGRQGDLNQYLMHCPCKQRKEEDEAEAGAIPSNNKKEKNGVELAIKE